MTLFLISKETLHLPTIDTPILLSERRFFRMHGKDRFEFLQGLITQDVFVLKEQRALYTLFLNPKGRFLFEGFLVNDGDSIILETDHRGEELLSYLKRYKLRRQVEIEEIPDFCTIILPKSSNENAFPDPRVPDLWQRFFVKAQDLSIMSHTRNLENYHFIRIAHGLAEGEDLVVEKTFPMEAGLDKFHALNFKKGCYIGQEPVARAHYQGVVRKTLTPIIYTDDRSTHPRIVDIRSKATFNNVTIALAMVRLEDNVE